MHIVHFSRKKEEQEEKSLLFGRPYLFSPEPPPISQGAEPKIMGNGLVRRKILAQGGQSCFSAPFSPSAHSPSPIPSPSPSPASPAGGKAASNPNNKPSPLPSSLPPPSWPTEFLHPSRGRRGEGGNGVACLFCIGGCGGGSPAPFPPPPPSLAGKQHNKQASGKLTNSLPPPPLSPLPFLALLLSAPPTLSFPPLSL